ncbi:MAG: hypothetical protein HC915_01790 [Anaerolineae bacterium]|nr:hypothetical protein [Anaerolineae bacterium]
MLGSLALTLLFGLSLFISGIPAFLVYGLPLLIGLGAYGGLHGLQGARPALALVAARGLRQVVFWGGAAILGAVVAAGIFVIAQEVFRVLYPDDSRSNDLSLAAGVALLVGLMVTTVFRRYGALARGLDGHGPDQ